LVIIGGMRHWFRQRFGRTENDDARTPSGVSGGAAHPANARPGRRLNLITLTVSCGVLLLASIAIGTVIMAFNFRDRAIANSQRELSNTSFLLARYLDAQFEELQLAEKDIIAHVRSADVRSPDDFERHFSGYNTHVMLKDKVNVLPMVSGVALFDSEGKVVNRSRTWPLPPINVADREFFQALKSDPQLTMAVSKPTRNRTDGNFTISLSHRIDAPNGDFLGVVGGSIDLHYFEKFFQSVTLGKAGTISIARGDGMMLARHPWIEATIGKTYQSLIDNLGTSDSLINRMTTTTDGIDRLLAARRLAHFPFIVVVGTETAAALADWREQTKLLVGAAGLSAIVIAAIFFAIVRGLLRAHKWSEQRLALEKHRLDTAIDNMSQGLLMFDASARVVVVNQRYIEMYNVSPDVVKPGCTFRELLTHRKEIGNFTDDVDEYCSDILADLAQGKATEFLAGTGDGRSIKIVNTPMAGGGWVATLEDVTRQRQAEQERERDREFLNQIIDHVPVMIAVKDAAERRFVLVNRTAEALWGISRAEALGKTARELFPAGQAEMIDKRDDEVVLSDTPLVLEAHPNMAGSGDPRIVTSKRLTIRGKDGKPQYLVSVVEDVTERKKIEEERDRNREFLNLIIDNIPTTIIVRDARDRRYVLINRTAEAYFGVPQDQIIGKTASDIYPKAMADMISAHDEQQLLQSGGRLSLEEHSIDTLGKGTRIVSPKRVTIFGADGQPQYLVSVIEDVTERRQVDARITHLAHHDALTDLPNRVLFREKLERALKWPRQGEQVAVLYCDLDNFKSVNDTLGHPVGDDLLNAVAVRLRGCLRDEDTVARLGGDEFAIIQTGVKQPSDVTDLMKRIFDVVREPYQLGGYQVTSDASFGIAMAPSDGTDPDQLLKNADLALYGAKSDGRGTYRFFEPAMDACVKARRELEADLRQAIATDGFELYYQPIINLSDNKIVGCEALLRWCHAKRGMVSPAEFIPVAEETGLITALGEWVLKTACTEATAWPDDIKVSVNVSPVQFKSQTLPLTIVGVLATSGLPARRLILEITEAVLIRDDDTALAMLKQLRVLGVQVAMDDFGTGYSSLSYLQRFPFDKIKIDRSFIETIADKNGSAAIVQAVVDIAKSRNIMTTAEGVETPEQMEMLCALGCDEMQGYLFSAAVPATALPNLFAPDDKDATPRRRAGHAVGVEF
jgi:diguanylate cyclase (GGDEF)-like protein/PAS domain S-box-containing protein